MEFNENRLCRRNVLEYDNEYTVIHTYINLNINACLKLIGEHFETD